MTASGSPELVVLQDAAAVAQVAAERIVDALTDAVRARGVAHWATTGGSSAPPIYRLLTVPPLRPLVDWSAVHIWWGDERYVPPDHPLSNQFPVDEILLADQLVEAGSGTIGFSGASRSNFGLDLPAANEHRVPTAEAIGHGRGAAWAASLYAEEIVDHGPRPGEDGLPLFDLVILGVGPDGHILSVFPGSAAWDSSELCVAVPAPSHVEPHLERITMHPRLVEAARKVIVIASGSSKAEPLANAWAVGDPREVPARITRRAGATWILDTAAAAGLQATAAD